MNAKDVRPDSGVINVLWCFSMWLCLSVILSTLSETIPRVIKAGDCRAPCAPSFGMSLTHKVTRKRCVCCVPLADVCISIGSLGGVHVAELGRSAAGCLELPVQSGPTSILPGTSPFSAIGGFGHSPRGQRPTDDDLFSQSTASTLRTRGSHGTQQDDAALHLAMSMVATVCSRHRRPLDAFMVTSGVSSTALPPKIEADEPSLLLTVALDHMSLSSCLHLPGASAPALCTGRGSAYDQERVRRGKHLALRCQVVSLAQGVFLTRQAHLPPSTCSKQRCRRPARVDMCTPQHCRN